MTKPAIITIVIVIILIVSFILPSNTVIAQELSITIFTSKSCYTTGTDVLVYGSVSQITGKPLSILLIAPNGNILSIDQMMPDPKGNYSKTISSKFLGDGNYTIQVIYSGAKTVSIMFEYGTTCLRVFDPISPVVTPPPDVVVEATGPNGAIVFYPPPTATDNVGVTEGPTCATPSGEIWPIGNFRVLCTAKDATGNEGKGYFSVIVQDTTPPTISQVADIFLETADPIGTIKHYPLPSVYDLVDPNPTVTCSMPSGSLFPVNNTMITCTAKDAADNSAITRFNIVVAFSDVTNPWFIDPPQDVEKTTTDSTGLTVSYSLPEASDDTGIANVTCDPPPGSKFSVGPTAVICTAKDSSNNTATTEFIVVVSLSDPPESDSFLSTEMTVAVVIGAAAVGGILVSIKAGIIGGAKASAASIGGTGGTSSSQINSESTETVKKNAKKKPPKTGNVSIDVRFDFE